MSWSSRPTSDGSAIPPQPDHFYPAPHIRRDWRDPNNPESYIWPDEDPAASRGIPVFKPKLAEFEDFEGYLNAIEPWGRRSGIVKVIPPKEWRDALPSVVPQLGGVRIHHPIAQEMIGSSGLFRQSNIEKRKTYSVREWMEMCEREENRTPSPSTVLKRDRGENRDSPRRRRRRNTHEVDPEDEDAMDEKEVERGMGLSPEAESQAPPTPDSLPDSTTMSTSDKPLANAPPHLDTPADDNASADERFLASFDPLTSWLPADTLPEHYTPEVCAQLERNFWRSIGNAGAPAWYGADLKGSLFTEQTKSWNVSSLPNPLSRLLGLLKRKLPGVNTPYLYFGMWRAAFAWHVEDMDLYSINYIHFGAPKLWWAMPSQKAKAFERTMKGYFPVDAKSCNQFLRHKSFLVSPTNLANSSCRPNVLVQHQGEFVITFPQGYHAGINLGFNCAESVNFALDGWEDVVRKANWCKCEKDSVTLDIDALLEEARGKEAEPVQTSKRKETKIMKKRNIDDVPDAHAAEEGSVAKKRKKERSSSMAKPATVRRPSTPPAARACILCPNPDEDTLVKVYDVPVFMRSMAGVQTWAHERCATVLPETWVDTLDGERWVFGVDAMEKARWDLKCAACTKQTLKNHGAKIQCTRGKCSRAYHVSCAIDKDEVVYIETGEVEKEVVFNGGEGDESPPPRPSQGTTGEESELLNQRTEPPPTVAGPSMQTDEKALANVIKTIKKPIFELLCPVHNPNIRLLAKQKKDETRKKNVLALKEGDRIRIRLSSGVFEVTLLQVDEEKEKVEVIWDDRSKRWIGWGSIHWGPVSEEVLAESKAKQQAKEEEALEARLNQYRESIRRQQRPRPSLPIVPVAVSTGTVDDPELPSSPEASAESGIVVSTSAIPGLRSLNALSTPGRSTLVSDPLAQAHLSGSPQTRATTSEHGSPQVERASSPQTAAGETVPTTYPYPYQAYGTYSQGYWAPAAYSGYWQSPSYQGNSGWYDYYGRWHEGAFPGYAFYTPNSSGSHNGLAFPSSSSSSSTPQYGYQPFVSNSPSTNVESNVRASRSYALSPIDVPDERTTTPVDPPLAGSEFSASTQLPALRASHPSEHVAPSALLDNAELMPLLNTLMKNETMRNTLLRLRDTITDRLPPSGGG